MTQESALSLMKTGKNIFLTGAPGTGKTYVINQYINYLKKHGIEVAITAPTGIAASHINGVTLQSFFGTGIRDSLSQYDIENLTEKKYLWDRMKHLQVLIIDEVSMLSPQLFESINQLLQTFKFNHEPFGGVQVILVGDFFQLPPVMKNQEEKKFIFQSPVWNELDLGICYLTTSFRHTDEILLNILNEMRSGFVSENSMNHFRKRYKKEPKNSEQITKLYTHNVDVDAINNQSLRLLDTPLQIFEAHTTGQKKWVERIFNNSLFLPKLELKKGALVFFIKNNYEKDYINGTLGTIIDFDVFGTPIVETRDGRHIKAERIEWTYTDNDGKALATIKQIPLRLAWAITIHKSQGMTLESAEIDLSQSFEPGQGYVALSRIQDIKGLKLMGLNAQALAVNKTVLEKDIHMRKSSEELHLYIENIDTESIKQSHTIFLQKLGGSIKKGNKKKEEHKQKKPKIKSFLESKKYFERALSISEIAKIRDVTEATIWKHLYDILDDDPEFDITYLQPDSNIIELVENTIHAIEKKRSPEDYLENGSIRLRSIFEKLDEKISYDDIKCAMLFLE